MRDPVVALLLGLVTALSRIPFVAQRLWEWDSVLYARALEHGFHVDDVLVGSRPHPPGYVFYLAAAALAKAVGLDSDHALVLVSVLASGAAVAACYLLCRRFAGSTVSLLLAVAFAADPLLWLHGEVAMPYVLLAPVATAVALAFRAGRGAADRRAVAASFLFGAIAGFRQDVLVLLLPLWLWMLVPATARTRSRSFAALAGGCLLWFVPSALLSDGPVEYVTRTARQLAGIGTASANAERSVAVNLAILGSALWWGLLFLTLAVAVLGLARLLALRHATARRASADAQFFALWLVPGVLFYVFVHIGEWGPALFLVPGLYGLLAWLIRPLVPRLVPAARAAGAALIVANALLGAWLFAFGDDAVFSAASLRAHDRATDAKTAYIRALPADSTVVLASAELLVAAYYLPDRTIWYSNRAATGRYERRLPRPTTVVVYEASARPDVDARSSLVEAAPGVRLELLAVDAGPLVLPGSDIDASLRR